MSKVRAIPDGMHTVTPAIVLKNCAEAIDFFKRAFGAVEQMRAPDPSGTKIWHAAFKIGDSTIFCNDEFPEMGSLAHPAQLWIYSEDVHAAFKRAVEAGAKIAMPVSDMFWGDRFGKVIDPWGNGWSLAQRVKDLTPDEMMAGQAAAVAAMGQKL